MRSCLWNGELGTASSATPASAASSRRISVRWERRDAKREKVSSTRAGLRAPARRGDGGDRAPVEGGEHVRRDLDLELVLAELAHDRVEAAGGDDLVADRERVLHRGVQARTASLRQDEQEPADDGEDGDGDQDLDVSRSSASRLKAANSRRSIASRAPRVSSRRKRRLWSESRRRPRSSFWFTRWRM